MKVNADAMKMNKINMCLFLKSSAFDCHSSAIRPFAIRHVIQISKAHLGRERKHKQGDRRPPCLPQILDRFLFPPSLPPSLPPHFSPSLHSPFLPSVFTSTIVNYVASYIHWSRAAATINSELWIQYDNIQHATCLIYDATCIGCGRVVHRWKASV